ncbi:MULTISPECIES: GNAT family N-acetyltransferase [Microbulbifer]|uniref:GNAT family N-acetyltransferase n=1 Tax=Microbulbifer celer TaxID=435905 RepID=A0ABW3U7J4_9GAMM|nr:MULTISPECIES: GNAT family N-acetyltransferase [Microbulbifer]UFN57073.1 GNAT family N-acetyltransferase [Microbulbifer celer]
MSIKIRRLEPSDAEQLTEIYRFNSVSENTSQLPYMSSDTVNSLFYESNNYTLVAIDSDRVLGHVTLFISHKQRERHLASVAIAVHPASHGRGIGKMLLQEALDQADNWLNLIRVELEVHTDNTSAIALYEKVGFVKEGERRFATFKSGKLANVLMMARLSPQFTAGSQQSTAP